MASRWFGTLVALVGLVGFGAACVPPSDGGGGSTTTTTVAEPEGPSFDVSSDEALPPPTSGEPYSLQLRLPDGSSALWQLVGGALPAGLTLSEDGIVSGVPSGPGQLWAADVRATPSTAPALADGRAAMSTTDSEMFHLWGWTYEPQEQRDFPGTVTTGADVPLTLFGFSGETTGFSGVWTLHPDGSTSQPSLAVVNGLPPEGVYADQEMPSLGGFEAPWSSGRLAVQRRFDSCVVDLVDVTQGPVVPLPIAATVQHSVGLAGNCRTQLVGSTLWMSASRWTGVGYEAVIDVVDVASAELLRTATVAVASGDLDIVYDSDGGRAWVVTGRDVSSVSVVSFGRSDLGDAGPVTIDTGACPLFAFGGISPMGRVLEAPGLATTACVEFGEGGTGFQLSAFRGVELDLNEGSARTQGRFARSDAPDGASFGPTMFGHSPAGQMFISTYTMDGDQPTPGPRHLYAVGGSAGSTPQQLLVAQGEGFGLTVVVGSFLPFS